MAVPSGSTVSDSFNAGFYYEEKLPACMDVSWPLESKMEKNRQEDNEIKSYLMKLDKLRQECELQGKFRDAQRCLDRIREVNFRYAKKVEIEAGKVNLGWKRQMMEKHRLELLTFNEMWEKKMLDYDEGAEKLRHELFREHTVALQSHANSFRREVMDKRPRPSKTLVNLRENLKVLVQQQMYVDADAIQKSIRSCEAKELREFEAELEKKVQERMQAVAERLRTERAAVEQRLVANREELIARRRQDFDTLVKKHAAALRALEQSVRLVVSKARDCINRQVRAFAKDPVKTGLELVHLSQTALGGAKVDDWGAGGREGTSLKPRGSCSGVVTELSFRCPSAHVTTLSRPPWRG